MTERVAVCPAEELPPGERTTVTVDGMSVGVFNVEGELYAVENRCAHLDGPLCDGAVKREIEATFDEPGQRVRERVTDRPTIACPWHGWEYYLESGTHIGNDAISVRSYDTVVEDDTVYVEV